MAQVEITDQKSLEAWLKTRPAADDDILAARIGLRVLPLWGGEMEAAWAIQKNLTALPILRILLIKSIARGDKAKYNRAQASDTAISAAGFYYANAYTAAAAQAAAAAVAAAAKANPSSRLIFWAAVSADAKALQNDQDLSQHPLWPSTAPDWFTKADAETRAIWAKDPDTWAFWLRWWDGVIAGKPLPFDLQHDVALIEDEIWQRGPKAVAKAIRERELRRAILLTPNAEEVLRDEAGLFYVLPLTTIKPNLFKSAVAKVSDDIAEIRSKPTLANALSFLTDDFQRLEDHFDRYGDQPLRIHDVFQKTMRHLDAMRYEGLLPDDVLLRDFYQDLDTGSVDIRRADTEVATAVKARVADRMARMKAGDKARANAALLAAANEARPNLKAEIEDDLDVTNDSTSEAADKDESSNRLVSRGLRMAKLRKDDLVKSADDLGKVVKGAEAAQKIGDALPGWWEFIQANFSSWFS